jgi:GAF domain-containing protein
MKRSPEKLLNLLRTFHDVTKLINSELELSSLIDTILSMLIRVMGAKSALMLQLDGATQTLREIASRGQWPFDLSLFDTVKVDHIAHCLVKCGSPINMRELIGNEGSERTTVVEKKSLKAIFCAPLEAKGRITGLICIHAATRELDNTELEMFCSLASQAAIAMENAGLYERLKKKLTITKEELKHTQAQLIRSEKSNSR